MHYVAWRTASCAEDGHVDHLNRHAAPDGRSREYCAHRHLTHQPGVPLQAVGAALASTAFLCLSPDGASRKEISLTTHRTIPVTFRPFGPDDYTRIVEISNANHPDDLDSVERMHHGDSAWDANRYDRLRIVAEDPLRRVVGSGQINHIPYQFHPRKYEMHIQVDPAAHRRGIGSAIYARLLD